ncbi:hypothetical protein QUF75_10790 [Desulfococcaceae bacterium HSG7]|nr:hypothetical protein [Desulfococcaceae bacterium HSG7]
MKKNLFALFCAIFIVALPVIGMTSDQKKTASQGQPDSLEIAYNKALELADQGKIEEAVAFLADILAKYQGAKNDSYYAVKLHLAAAYMRLGKEKEANKIWDSILREPKHIDSVK